MKNYTTKEVNGLLDELMDLISNNITGGTKTWDEVKIQFKKDKGLILTLPEIGKWFITEYNGMSALVFCKRHSNTTSDEVAEGYGIGYAGRNWYDDQIAIYTKHRLATKSEVDIALIAEAKTKAHTYDNYRLWEGDNTFQGRDDGCSTWTDLLINGKWAKPIIDKPTEMTIAQIESKHGYTNLKIIAE